MSIAKLYTVGNIVERESIESMANAFLPFKNDYAELRHEMERDVAANLVNLEKDDKKKKNQ